MRVSVWLIIAVLSPALAVEAQVRPQQVDKVLAQWNRPDSPGCAIGVIQDGRLVFQRGYGAANLDYGIANGPDMVYYVGSVSKQFTAAAIAILAHDGRISLDDPVSKYIPEVSHLPMMTVRQLVNHTAGVRDVYVLMSLAGLRLEDVLPEDRAIGLIARQKELNFAPGSDYLYSNSGYLFLATIIKRVAGESLRTFAEKRIFAPLGMTQTHFHDEPYHVIKNRVMSYAPDGDDFRITYIQNFDKIGAGGLYTTLGDLSKWDANFYDNRLTGGKALLDMLHTRGVLTNGEVLPYAFGLQIGSYRRLRTVRHSGSLMGFKAEFVRFPDQRLSIATLCNLATINPTTLSNQVADLYLAEHIKAAAAAAGGTATEPASPPATAAAAPVATSSPVAPVGTRPAAISGDPTDLAGRYRSDELDVTYTVEAAGGELRLSGGLLEKVALRRDGPDTFAGGSYVFRFQRDAAGRVSGFTVQAGRVRNIRFVREGR